MKDEQSKRNSDLEDSDGEPIEVRRVVIDGCPAEALDKAAVHLYEKLCEVHGEPPEMIDAFKVGLITGVVHLMDTLGMHHDYKAYSLVIQTEELDS